MIEFGELEVQITLSIRELQTVVSLINLAGESLPEEEYAEALDTVGTISELYFDLMQNLHSDGYLGQFQPE